MQLRVSGVHLLHIDLTHTYWTTLAQLHLSFWSRGSQHRSLVMDFYTVVDVYAALCHYIYIYILKYDGSCNYHYTHSLLHRYTYIILFRLWGHLVIVSLLFLSRLFWLRQLLINCFKHTSLSLEDLKGQFQQHVKVWWPPTVKVNKKNRTK